MMELSDDSSDVVVVVGGFDSMVESTAARRLECNDR